MTGNIGDIFLGVAFLMVLGGAAIAATIWAIGQVRDWREGHLDDKWELWVSLVLSVIAVLVFVGVIFLALGYEGQPSGVVVEKQTKWIPNPALKNIPTIHYQLVLREDGGDYNTVDVSEEAYNHLSPGDWYEGK